jgi:hypothetical protein
MSLPLQALRKLPDDDLIEKHDELAQHTTVSVNYYLDELARRDNQRATDAMVRLTYVIAALTFVNVVAIILSLIT